MKLLLLLCFMFAVSGINAFAIDILNIMKLVEKVNKYITECITEGAFEFNDDDLERIFSNVEDFEKEGMKEITHCFFDKAGILKPDGTLNKKTAKKILTLIGLEKDQADKILQKCGSITGVDEEETAYAIFDCVDEAARG
ncbi:hypothetical protein PYW08_004956 [Mythimna loreyi]|uniref:Uncharacterized protein n=1 Tax=Mythimna loreyi TaxID=667449 RepID=A0ACC2QDS6_9NEOP|nr:hypothetical protein PYW08_004956 [Mythimna loreyi]